MKNSNPCFSEKKYSTKASTNCLSTQVNSTHNTFRKNFCLSLKKKEDPPIAFINITNLKNQNYNQNYSTTPNTTKNFITENNLKTNNNNYVIIERIQSEQEPGKIINEVENLSEEDLTCLEEKQNVLDKEISKQLSLLKYKLNIIRDDNDIREDSRKEESKMSKESHLLFSKNNTCKKERDEQQRYNIILLIE